MQESAGIGSQRRVINFGELAYRMGSRPEEMRRAGAALFDCLAGDDPDISKALIAACSASAVEPRQLIVMLSVLADEFRRPTDESANQWKGQSGTDAHGYGEDVRKNNAITERLTKLVRLRRNASENGQ